VSAGSTREWWVPGGTAARRVAVVSPGGEALAPLPTLLAGKERFARLMHAARTSRRHQDVVMVRACACWPGGCGGGVIRTSLAAWIQGRSLGPLRTPTRLPGGRSGRRPWVGPARGRSLVARRSWTGRPVLADLARAGDHDRLQSARDKADGPPLLPHGHDDDSDGAGQVLAVAAGGRCRHPGRHRDDHPDRPPIQRPLLKASDLHVCAPGRTRTCNLRIRGRPTNVYTVQLEAVLAAQVGYVIRLIRPCRAELSMAE
jgi:hypothetical protein